MSRNNIQAEDREMVNKTEIGTMSAKLQNSGKLTDTLEIHAKKYKSSLDRRSGFRGFQIGFKRRKGM